MACLRPERVAAVGTPTPTAVDPHHGSPIPVGSHRQWVGPPLAKLATPIVERGELEEPAIRGEQVSKQDIGIAIMGRGLFGQQYPSTDIRSGRMAYGRCAATHSVKQGQERTLNGLRFAHLRQEIVHTQVAQPLLVLKPRHDGQVPHRGFRMAPSGRTPPVRSSGSWKFTGSL